MSIINKPDVKYDARKWLVASGISKVYLWAVAVVTVKDRIVQKRSQQLDLHWYIDVVKPLQLPFCFWRKTDISEKCDTQDIQLAANMNDDLYIYISYL